MEIENKHIWGTLCLSKTECILPISQLVKLVSWLKEMQCAGCIHDELKGAKQFHNSRSFCVWSYLNWTFRKSLITPCFTNHLKSLKLCTIYLTSIYTETNYVFLYSLLFTAQCSHTLQTCTESHSPPGCPEAPLETCGDKGAISLLSNFIM